MKFLTNCTGCANRRAKMKKALNNIIVPKLNIYSRLSMFQERLWNQIMPRPFMGYFDNVAGVRFHKLAYGTIGAKQHLFEMQPEKARIDMSVSVTVFANAAQQGVDDAALTTQIDRGTAQYGVTPDTAADPCFAFGYSITGEHYLSGFGSIGVMDNAVYTDGGSTSRTIKGLYVTDVCGGNSDEDRFYFSIDTINVPNTDATWLDITWDDISGTPRVIDRSADATTYTGSLNGSTHWRDLNAVFDWTDTDANTDVILTTS